MAPVENVRPPRPTWRSGFPLALPHIVLAVILEGVFIFYVPIFEHFFSGMLKGPSLPKSWEVVTTVADFCRHILFLPVLLITLWADVWLHAKVRHRCGETTAQVLPTILTLVLLAGFLLTARGLMAPFEVIIRLQGPAN